jgi:uncharacterized protein (DUF433 family)
MPNASSTLTGHNARFLPFSAPLACGQQLNSSVRLPSRGCLHQRAAGVVYLSHNSGLELWNGDGIMPALQEIEKLLLTLSRAEKAQVLQWIASDLGEAFPGIESTPGVCGGELCIVRTRIPVWVLVQARRLGTSEADLLRSYPTLRAEDLANAWAYARAHQEEIEQQILANETA